MINEPSTYASGQSDEPENGQYAPPTAEPVDNRHRTLREAAAEVMQIAESDQSPPRPLVARFWGQLTVNSERAYEHIDRAFDPLNCHAVLTTDEADGRIVIMAVEGRVRPQPRPWWPNALLLVLTLLSLLYVGAVHDAGLRDVQSIELWRGWPYALSMILILGAHELGHYFAGRYHKVSVTLPYFIPVPIGFGTLGAFIQLREPMPSRKVLFDVGVAGPIAGLVMTIPILLIGLATSDVRPLPDEDYMLEGDSLFYAGAKVLVFGEAYPNDSEDVFINQLAKAGWTGLFITGLNLIPLGQLDGGHVISTLFGAARARRLYLPIVGVFLVLSFFNSAWMLWTLLLLLLGRVYAVPLNNLTPLDTRRQRLGYLALIIFVLVFVPNPLQLVQV